MARRPRFSYRNRRYWPWPTPTPQQPAPTLEERRGALLREYETVAAEAEGIPADRSAAEAEAAADRAAIDARLAVELQALDAREQALEARLADIAAAIADIDRQIAERDQQPDDPPGPGEDPGGEEPTDPGDEEEEEDPEPPQPPQPPDDEEDEPPVEPQPPVGNLTVDGVTPTSISVAVMGQGPFELRLAPAGSDAWQAGLEMNWNRAGDQSAGMAVRLAPDMLYDVEVRRPGGAVEARRSIRTRRWPIVAAATPANTRPVSTLAAAQAAIAAARPGDVIQLAPGVYRGTLTIQSKNGQDGNPITLRGAAGHASIVDPDGGWGVLLADSNYIHIEGLHVRNADTGIELRDWNASNGTIGNTVRENLITDVTIGIKAECNGRSGPGHDDLVIIGNTLEGRNAFGNFSSSTWDDEGIVVNGVGVEVAWNTLSGFGDALGMGHSDGEIPDSNRAIVIHNNLVLWSGDDGVELDFSDRNTAAYDNLLSNCSSGVSFQFVTRGPAYAFDNLIFNTNAGPFKIKPEAQYNENVRLYHNTSVRRGWAWQQDSGNPDGISVLDNLFVGSIEPGQADVLRLDTTNLNDVVWGGNGYAADGLFQVQVGGRKSLYQNFAAWKRDGLGTTDTLLDAIFAGGMPATGMAAWRDPRRVDFTLADGAVRGNAVPVAGLGGRSYIGARAGVEEVTFGAEAAIPQAPETPHEPEEPDEPAEPPAGGGDDDEPPAPPTVPPTAGAGWSVATPRPFTDFIGPDGDRAPDSSSEIVLKSAWTGPAFNPLTLEWVLTGGGHKDRSGNEILKALLGTGAWSVFKGNTYPAEPVGTHNYGGLVVHPDANVLSMQTGGGGYYEGESMKGPRPVFTIDLTTGAVRSHPGTEADHYGFAGYNPKTREVWGVSTSGGYIIGADGVARGVPVTGAANWCQFAGGMAYDPVTDAMYAIRADYENGLLKVTKTGSGLNVERIGGVPGSIAAHAGIAFRRDTGIGFIWGGGKAITTLDAASRQFGAIATPGVAVPAATNGAFHFHYSGRSDAFFGQPYDRVYRFQM